MGNDIRARRVESHPLTKNKVRLQFCMSTRLQLCISGWQFLTERRDDRSGGRDCDTLVTRLADMSVSLRYFFT